MGMRKKWSRLITVDEVRYRYHVASDSDGMALSICVQRNKPAGQRLLSGFQKPHEMVLVGPGHWWGRVHSTRGHSCGRAATDTRRIEAGLGAVSARVGVLLARL